MTQNLIQALQNPSAYPHPVTSVRLIETHISWILLTGDYAYKIKKPVDFGFLDFSTLAKRKQFCQEELRLNQRFSDTLYLDVVAITGSIEQPRVAGQGQVLEYAVRMREFPQQSLLSSLLGEPEFDPSIIDQLADKLADFHQRAVVVNESDASSSGDAGSVASVCNAALDNFAHIQPLLGDKQDLAEVDRLQAWTASQCEQLQAVFGKRLASGFVRECHGDLHLENIAVIDGEVIFFDCIEFNKEFRYIDVISELAYVAMDLEYRGEAGLANRLVNRYLEHTGDYAGMRLLDFYRVYRAMVRAKVAILRSQQAGISQTKPGKAGEDFYQHLRLARNYCRSRQPFLAIMHGVSGTGKSTASEAIAQALACIRLRSDVERKRLFGLHAEQSSQGVDGGIYTADASEKTFSCLRNLAGQLLAAGFPVIVDATFLSAKRRQQFSSLAKEARVPFVVLDCYLDDDLLEQRLLQRSAAKAGASEADVTVMRQQLQKQDVLTGEEGSRCVRVCTNEVLQGDALTAVQQAIRAVTGLSGS